MLKYVPILIINHRGTIFAPEMDRVFKIFLLYILFFIGSAWHLSVHANRCSFSTAFTSESVNKSSFCLKNASGLPTIPDNYCFDDIDDNDDDTVVRGNTATVVLTVANLCQLIQNNACYKSYLHHRTCWNRPSQDKHILHCIIRV